MVRTSRRRLLAVGGLAALAGCLTDDTDDGTSPESPNGSENDGEGDDNEASPPELFGMVPRKIDGNAVSNVQYSEPIDLEAEIPNTASQQGIVEELELDPEAVDGILFVIYGDLETQEDGGGLWLLSGSFDADAPELGEDGEEDATLVQEDGFFLAAFQFGNDGDEGWEVAVDAVESTRESEEEGVLEDESAVTALDPVAGFDSISLVFEAPYTGWYSGMRPRGDTENLDTVAIGTNAVEERTVEATHAALFESTDAVDESAIVAQMQAIYGREIDPDTNRDGALVVASAVHEIPPEPDRDASPDAHFTVDYADSDGVATIRHRQGESVPASELTVLVEDEPAEVSWDGSSVEEGDTVELDVDPLTAVRVEWRDPDNENVFGELGSGLAVDSSVFETSFDARAGEATIDYQGRKLTRTDRLVLGIIKQGDDHNDTEEELVSDRHATLETGDTIVVSDVTFGDQITLRVEYGSGPTRTSEHIAHLNPRPPGRFHYEQSEQQIVFYGAEEEVEPDNYRVLIDGQPAPTQFADEYDTLTEEATLSVDAEPGDEIIVKWTGTGEPYPILETVVLPPAEFEFSRNGDLYRLEYVAEEPWPADEFEIVSHESDSFDVQFADEYDTLEQGDSVEFDLESGQFIEVLWKGPNDEHGLHSAHVGRAARFELGYEDRTVQLTFQGAGTWPADVFEVELNEESLGTPFAEEYDSLESGDSIPINDAELGDEVAVLLADESESQSVFSDTVVPETAFTFEETGNTVEITYDSGPSIDAKRLDVRLFGDEGEQRVDPWGEQGTVDPGDTVSVEVADDTVAVVVNLDEHTHLGHIELDDDE